MAVTFDPDKSDRNVADRGLALNLVDQIDWRTALIWEDRRHEYGELRLLVHRIHRGSAAFRRRDAKGNGPSSDQPAQGKQKGDQAV